MALHTLIEYCDSTVNAQMGCDGCELWSRRSRMCYAGSMTETYAGNDGWPTSFDKPIIFPERIEAAAKWPDLSGTKRPNKPWLDGYPRIIFLNDMGDTFTESLPFDWLRPYMDTIEFSPHIWLILTKRPSRMVKFFDALGYVPDNVWCGVSVTSQRTVPRLNSLIQLPDYATLWLSVEPQLDDILIPAEVYKRIDLMVLGGASGAEARPYLADHARRLRDDCAAHGVKFFFKQWGEFDQWGRKVGKKAAGRTLDGQVYSELPDPKFRGQLSLFGGGR